MGEYLNISAEDNPWKITCPNVPFTCLKYIKPMQLMWKSEICSRPSDKSCRYCTSPTVICTRLRRSDKWNYEPCASKWVPEPFGQASLRDWELLHVGKHALWQLSSGSSHVSGICHQSYQCFSMLNASDGAPDHLCCKDQGVLTRANISSPCLVHGVKDLVLLQL